MCTVGALVAQSAVRRRRSWWRKGGGVGQRRCSGRRGVELFIRECRDRVEFVVVEIEIESLHYD